MAQYTELLKDPRWQRKRLEIMERANFACEICDDNETTLHIHHGYYQMGVNPWEYHDETLHCLCEKCHEVTSKNADFLKKLLGHINPADMEQIIGYVLAIALSYPIEDPSMDEPPSVNYETFLGIAQYRANTKDDVVRQLIADYKEMGFIF